MRKIIHCHQAPGLPCAACGVPDDGETFTTDPGYWNSINTTCEPATRLSPTFEVTGRADPRTSALKGERKPDPKRVRDPR